MGGTSVTLMLAVCGGIRMPLSACSTTFGVFCAETGTSSPRLCGLRAASASDSLSILLDGGEGTDDRTGGENSDGLAKVKAVCCRGAGRKFDGCEVTPDEVSMN